MNNPNPKVLILTAPLSGQLVPLERVPDPVFAHKMIVTVFYSAIIHTF